MAGRLSVIWSFVKFAWRTKKLWVVATALWAIFVGALIASDLADGNYLGATISALLNLAGGATGYLIARTRSR